MLLLRTLAPLPPCEAAEAAPHDAGRGPELEAPAALCVRFGRTDVIVGTI